MSIADVSPETTALWPPAFLAALTEEVGVQQARYPGLADALGRAKTVLTDGFLFPEEDGLSATCWNSTREATYAVNGACTCADAVYRANHRCKHRLALRLYQLVVDRLTAPPVKEAAPTIKPEWLETINGKPFIKYMGLLQLAHAAGLQALTAEWTYNDEALSLARAVATFADGRTFTEQGDASPESGKRVGLHWRRVSLTRAKARCLRDALAIDLCSAEEMD